MLNYFHVMNLLQLLFNFISFVIFFSRIYDIESLLQFDGFLINKKDTNI